MRSRRGLGRRLLAVALVVGVAASCGTADASPSPPPMAQEPPALQPLVGEVAGLDALGVLSTLEVAPQHLGSPAYDRAAWPNWADADGNGCDTRAEVLLAEALVAPAVADGCRLEGGAWSSLYDGRPVTDAAELDIDHLVPLAEAHRSGRWAWDAATKVAYANDLDDGRTLVAVTAAANRSKGDRDPAAWLPDQGVCRYVGDWVAVKAAGAWPSTPRRRPPCPTCSSGSAPGPPLPPGRQHRADPTVPRRAGREDSPWPWRTCVLGWS